jgi:hypothetical protein
MGWSSANRSCCHDQRRLQCVHAGRWPIHPPLPSTQVGDGPVLLVVENDNTFNSIRAARTGDPGPVGHVAWGVGGAFEASVSESNRG